MFENFKRVIGIGLVAGAGAIALEQDTSKHFEILENVATTYYQSAPGEKVILDLATEIPSYRLSDIQEGNESIGVYCGVNGSNEGEIDSKNVILPYGKLKETSLSFELPRPGATYDGKWGYGYFIVCGKEGKFTEKGIEHEGEYHKPDFTKRVVYLVMSESKKDMKSVFTIK